MRRTDQRPDGAGGGRARAGSAGVGAEMGAEVGDGELLGRFRRGEMAGFDGLFRRYAGRVHGTAYRLMGDWEDAEDVLQEVFLRLARGAGKIRDGRALGTWIYRTTFNCAMDRLRARRRTVSLDGDEPGARRAAVRIIAVESLRREALAAERVVKEGLLERVERLIPKLPERQGAVFVLRFYQGLSHREIAEILETSETGAKSLHCLACRRLRELTGETEGEERGEAPRRAAKGEGR